MKLSVTAFRAQASAQRKILSSYQNQLNYGACTSYSAVGSFKLDDKPQMMVDNTGIGLPSSHKSNEQGQSSETSREDGDEPKMEEKEETKDKDVLESQGKKEEGFDKSPGRTRTKSNQRWMKLRTTVQLSGAIASTNQKSKPQLKREDSFLKRFSTRQIPETQETVDTGDETETLNGSQTQNEVNRRRRKRRKELSKTVVNPDENFYFYWLMTVTVCVLYNLWTLIVRQSFPELQKVANEFWYTGDGFTDVIFACDIMVQFRTGYLEQGLMVYDSKKLATHYLKSRAFILDILSLIPLDFLLIKFGVNPILRFPRFLKVYRVYNYYYIVESRTVYPNLWRVVNLIHILLILAHWFGCFYYLLSEAEKFQGDWVYPYRPGDYATLTRKYLGSLYWSTLTLTTIGDLPTPETNAEYRNRSKAMISSGQQLGIPRRGHKSRLLQFNSNYGYLFTIISYLIGVFIFATIVGQVGNVITNRNANRLEFERLLDGAKTYMRHHKVPGGMKRRVLRWYDYSWSRGRIQGGGDINTALGLLPDKLKTELALHVNLSVLKKVTIFQECQPEFLHDLVLKMKAYIFTPGDLICRKGEVAREMFIIADGILDVISDTGRVLTTMKAGDFFGEIGILNLDGLNKRTADVRSVGYSELFSLSREDVLTAMKDYPEAQDILQSLGRKRLMEAKNASKMYKSQAKQAKDYDSSGDSDAAGKRIVEKLRSDVKGLKNVLRRSRRGTRTKETIEKMSDLSERKGSHKKQSILRRMSHVQSSDEQESGNDTIQSPIGAGLPLLQRLKMLKEKQDKEKEEKNKFIHLTESQNQKEGISSTVRTQLTGVHFEKYVSKSKSDTSQKIDEKNLSDGKDSKMFHVKKKETQVVESDFSKEKEVLASEAKEVMLPSKNTQISEAILSSNLSLANYSETSSNVPPINEENNSVPKPLECKTEVPKSKNAWKLLKKSSISNARVVGRGRVGENCIQSEKMHKRGTYLSKSDTVLEKQKTIESQDRHSRSESPSGNAKLRKKTLKQIVEEMIKERRKTKGKVSDQDRTSGISSDVSEGSRESVSKYENEQRMKKYNSISDLSPEFSGLPFVKKLKILNERQKLEELEKELLVRSASLDGSGRTQTKPKSLIRSYSEAGTIEVQMEKNTGESIDPKFESSDLRNLFLSEKKFADIQNSEVLIASPESNETMERRHLKSILKKLSAEGSTSDEDQFQTFKSKSGFSSKKKDDVELKKLMRAPTVEGYAARHKKLTKSVTFDSDTLPSSPEPTTPEPINVEDNKAKGFSPLSPTAILTLQLSNLSMIPIVNPKNAENKKNMENESQSKEKLEIEGMFSKLLEDLQEEIQKIQNLDLGNENQLLPYSVQDLKETNFRLLSLNKNPYETTFEDVILSVRKIIQRILEQLHDKFLSHYSKLQLEMKKRDDIIAQLLTKIQELEREDSSKTNLGLSSPTAQILSFSPAENESPRFDKEILYQISGKKNTKMAADNLDNVAQHPERYNYSETEETEDDIFEIKDKISLISNYKGNPLKKNLRGSLSRAASEEVEGQDISRVSRPDELKKKKHRIDLKLKRNFSVDENQIRASSKSSSKKYKEYSFKEEKRKSENKHKDKLINRMTGFQRSLSYTQENRDFIALEVDDSSTSSDVEQPHNKDWEVEMLAEELKKKENNKRREENWTPDIKSDIEEMEDVKRLQEEVNTLKQMVCGSDLTRLTSSELDILETILEAKDLKISQIAKSNSLDDDYKQRRKYTHIYVSDSDNKIEKCGQKKRSLRQKIGQTLSFDFYDFENRKTKSPELGKYNPFSAKKHKMLSNQGSFQEKQNLHSLLHTSSLLRNRVLEDSADLIKKKTNLSTISLDTRSSMPVLISSSPNLEKDVNLRKSLPALTSNNDASFQIGAADALNSSDDIDFGKSCDSVFEEPQDPSQLLELKSFNNPSTSGAGKSRLHEDPENRGLNNFIKNLGQRVKQVVGGDVCTNKNQVPTISKLCDEQSVQKDVEKGYVEECSAASKNLAEEDKNFADNNESAESNFKTDPPDL